MYFVRDICKYSMFSRKYMFKCTRSRGYGTPCRKQCSYAYNEFNYYYNCM